MPGGVGVRVARLFAAILLVGGMAAGPAVHLSADAGSPAAESHSGQQQGGPQLPDLHHNCPICITLASAAVPVVPAVSAAVLVVPMGVAPSASELRGRDSSDATRARAPPLG